MHALTRSNAVAERRRQETSGGRAVGFALSEVRRGARVRREQGIDAFDCHAGLPEAMK